MRKIIFDKSFIVIAFLLVITVLLLVCFHFLEPGIAGFERSYYRKNIFSMLSFRHFLTGVCSLIVLGGLPFFNLKFPKIILLLILIISSLMLNLSLFRPFYYSMQMRVCTALNPDINPFAFASFGIEDPMKYPVIHYRYAQNGYLNAPTHKKRLTTYPPGLPLFYYFVNHLAFSLPYVKTIMTKIALSLSTPTLKLEEMYPDELKGKEPEAVLFELVHILFYLLSIISVYCLVYELSGHSGGKALMGAASVAVLPAFVLYATTESILFVPFSTFILYIFVRYKSRLLPVVFVLGFLLALALFFSLVFLPFILFFLLLLIFEKNCLKEKAKSLVLFLIGILSGSILLYLLFQYNTLEMILTAISNNREFYRLSCRTYFRSLIMNIFEFSVMSGIAWILVALMFFLIESRSFFSVSRMNGFICGPMNKKLFLIFYTVFIMLLFSGSVRGEVGRNWMVFMPFILVPIVSMRIFSKTLYFFSFTASSVALLILSLRLEVIFNYWQ